MNTLMGIEDSWKKSDFTKKSEELLKVSEFEWNKARAAAESYLNSNRIQTPFKLSRKMLQKIFPDDINKLHHSFVVVPDGKEGFQLGAMARGKTYQTEMGENILEGILGHGTFGFVKIIQWENGNTDAIKIEGAEGGTRNKMEHGIMQAIGYLKHAFVQQREKTTEWIKKEQIKDKQYTIQKLHAGQEMREFLNKTPLNTLSPSKKYEIAMRSAQAIAQLHDLNILHCDIKPANFMLDATGNTVVVAAIDFGFSTRLVKGSSFVILYSPAGSPAYMAPEIATWEIKVAPGKAQVEYITTDCRYSKASDIYALGVMFQKDLKLAEINSPLKEIVERMMDNDPKKRPTMIEVIRALTKPDNYENFKKLYSEVDQYYDEKLRKSSQLNLFNAFRINAKDQLTMAVTLNETIQSFRQADVNAEEAADQILNLLRNNQAKHETSKFSMASTFNLKTIQNLPQELQEIVCKKLNITSDSTLLTDVSYASRKKLAKILNEFKPKPKETPFVPPPP